MAAKDQSISQSIADSIITHQVNLLRVAANLRGPILAELERLRKGLVREITDLPLDAGTIKRARLSALLRQTDGIITESYATIAENHGKSLADIAGIEQQKIGKVIDGAVGVRVMTVGLTSEQLAQMAKDTLIKGYYPAQWWDQQSQELKQRFMGQMNEGIARGEGIDGLTRRARGLIDAKKSQAEAIVRTSVLTVANQAKLDSFENNLDVIKAVQWMSTLDSRTTEQCIALDGKQWELPGYKPIGHTILFPGPTAHWNCRSTQIAVTKSWAELSTKKAVKPPVGKPEDIEAIFRRQLAAKGFSEKDINTIVEKKKFTLDGMPAPRQSMGEFLVKQNKGFQDDLLGVQKAQLWREGKISLTDLVDQNSRPLPLDELRQLVAKNQVVAATKRVEGQDGLGLVERTLLEESVVHGAQQSRSLTHFFDPTTGIRASFEGTSPPADLIDRVSKFQKVVYLRNGTTPGELFTPQELGLFGKLKNFEAARIVDVKGKVVSITAKPSADFTAAEAVKVNIALSSRTNMAPAQAFQKAINDNGMLRFNETASNTIVPPASLYTKAPDKALTTPFVDESSVPGIARTIFEKASLNEPGVTSAIQQVVEAGGGQMAGLEFKLKDQHSLARKIANDAKEKGITFEAAGSQIADALRYTAGFEAKDYTAGVLRTLASVEASGVKVERVKNFWDGISYEGINVKLKTKDGVAVELQFHTPESFRVKNTVSHAIYEKMRVTTDPVMLKKHQLELIDVWKGVAMPSGVETISDNWRDMMKDEIATAEKATAAVKKGAETVRKSMVALDKQLVATRAAKNAALLKEADAVALLEQFDEKHKISLKRHTLEIYGEIKAERDALIAALPPIKSELYNAQLAYNAEKNKVLLEARKKLILPTEEQAQLSINLLEETKRRGIVKETAEKALKYLQQLMPKGVSHVRDFDFTSTNEGRSHFEPKTALIRLGPQASEKSALHELAHALEYYNDEMLSRSVAFLEKRTAGETAMPLRELMPGYSFGDGEVAKPDKFYSPYAGKIYRDERTGKYFATEIMSKGLEELWFNPVEFAASDPEYFDFVLSSLRTLIADQRFKKYIN